MKTVKEIVKDFLIAHGYDGLWNDDCGCFLVDLMPCNFDGIHMCKAGHKRLLSDGDWIIGPKKEK